jgi:hypothetical protein
VFYLDLDEQTTIFRANRSANMQKCMLVTTHQKRPHTMPPKPKKVSESTPKPAGDDKPVAVDSKSKANTSRTLELLLAGAGLYSSFLTWGYMQVFIIIIIIFFPLWAFSSKCSI